MGLRTHEGVAFAELAPLGLTPEDPRVRDLRQQGLLVADAGRVVATARGPNGARRGDPGPGGLNLQAFFSSPGLWIASAPVLSLFTLNCGSSLVALAT